MNAYDQQLYYTQNYNYTTTRLMKQWYKTTILTQLRSTQTQKL